MYRKLSSTLTARELLHRQGYNFVSETGSAAVKPCLWCKRAIRGGEQCYKHQFYGIETAKCVQLTPTMRCNQRCLFCWRSLEHELESETELSPEEIVNAIPALQRKGLSGEKPFSDQNFWIDATSHPSQFAISLSGEPTLYSQLPELISLLKMNSNSVFVVSNGTNPMMIQKIMPTQLYISLEAGTEERYEEVCRPLGDPKVMWKNILTSLSFLKEKEQNGIRTAIRITLVNGLNNTEDNAKALAEQINRAQPMFVEIKGYMYLGFSRQRLTEEAVPNMEDIRNFAKRIGDVCGYIPMDENIPSRVVVYRRHDITFCGQNKPR